jgi:hypothetical protein
MKQNWNILACCLNWKVIVGVVVAAGALFLVAPSVALAAIPVLLVAICPLSMLLMMWGMRGGPGTQTGVTNDLGMKSVSGTDELSALRARIARVQDENEIIARELARSPRRPADGGEAATKVAGPAPQGMVDQSTVS